MGDGQRTLKYELIKKAILQDIRERGLAPGDQIDSISEIMTRFGVSKVTAVRSMVELENDGIVRREHGRGTFVAPGGGPGGELPVRQAVAVIVPDMANPFYAEVVGSLERRLREADLAIELSSTDYQLDQEERLIDLLVREQRVSGVVLCSMDSMNKPNEGIFDLPLVVIDNCPPNLLGRCNFIASDNLQGGYEATQHLIGLGHRRIGYIDMAEATRDRLAGFRRAMSENGLAGGVGGSEAPVLLADWRRKISDEVVDFVREHRLSALFAVNDIFAMQAMQILRRHGYRIPHDISIVGYDNVDAAKYLEVPLTTIEQHEEEMGRRAAEVLLETLKGGPGAGRPREIVLMPRLVVRASTAAPPLQD